MLGSKSGCFAVLLALLVFSAVNAQKTTASEKNNKLNQMREMALNSNNYIVEMDSRMYK